MFLIRQACLLKGKKKWIRKKILKQCEMTHRRVEGFWDIDNREEVLNGKNLQSPDNSIKEWWAGRGKNGIGLKGGGEWGNWLIFLFRRHDREVGLHMSFQCRRTRTIPALNSIALELNSTVFAANLKKKKSKHLKHVTLCQTRNTNYTLSTRRVSLDCDHSWTCKNLSTKKSLHLLCQPSFF